MKEIKANSEPDIVIAIIGNKVDLCRSDPSLRQVTLEEGKNLASSQGALFKETSAVENINVKDVFEGLIESKFTYNYRNI